MAKVDSTQFSQGALYEIGLALSFFQIREFADEFIAVLIGGSSPESPMDLVLMHYEKFDSRYKALLPLKRVYASEPIEVAG